MKSLLACKILYAFSLSTSDTLDNPIGTLSYPNALGPDCIIVTMSPMYVASSVD